MYQNQLSSVRLGVMEYVYNVHAMQTIWVFLIATAGKSTKTSERVSVQNGLLRERAKERERLCVCYTVVIIPNRMYVKFILEFYWNGVSSWFQ